GAAAGDAEAADAGRRVRLTGQPQERQRLVGARVQRADDDRPVAGRLEDLRVRGGLLVRAGLLVPAEEQELGAEQADAGDAGEVDAVEIGGGADVDHQVDRAPVGGTAGPRR